MIPSGIAALTFDTDGTVVDWRTSVLEELRAFGARHRLDLDWVAFLAEWQAAGRPGMDRVNRGEWPWITVDEIYRRELDRLLAARGATGLPDDAAGDLARAWWRLRPWPDALPGLRRLKRRFVISPLSNASFAGMVHLARFAELPWDCVLTAEHARCYKPRAEVYQTAIRLLGLAPSEVMMVAAHNEDLRAAWDNGMRTAFVPRPAEHGPGQTTDLAPEGDWDLVARDLEDLATRLGA